MFRILYKITIILVLVAVFPMALAIRNADHLVTQNIQSSLNTNVIRLASSLNRVISEYQTRYLLEAELVAGSAELVQAVEREGFYFRINDILPRYRRLLSADSLYLYHPDGLLLGNSGWGVAAGGGVLSSARTDGFFTNLVVQDGKIVFFNSAVVRNGSGVLISQYILNRRMAKEIGELIGAEVAFTIPGAGTITSLDDTGGFDRATVWVTSNRTALLTNLQLGSGPFRSCFMPLLNSSGKLVGVASVHLPTSSLSVIRAGNRINLMVVGFIATLVAVMVGFIFSFGITNPIGRLLRWTQVLASGDLEHRVSIQSRDEIGRLAESFDEMRLRILEVNRSLESKVEERTLQLAEERNQLVIRNEIMERELEMARNIQRILLPTVSPHPSIAFAYEPMEKVGGDFFDFIHFADENLIGIFISDVSGHGVPAAFITSMIKANLTHLGEKEAEDPASLMRVLNRNITNRTHENYVTVLYGVYHRRERRFVYSNAGHTPPYLISSEGVALLDNLNPGPPLALFPEEFLAANRKTHTNHTITLPESSRLLLYTDGLSETVPYIYRRHRRSIPDFSKSESGLVQTLSDTRQLPAGDCVKELMRRLREYRGSEQFDDDVCVVCLDA